MARYNRSRRANELAFPSLQAERGRALQRFGIDIEASYRAWMVDMIGEDGADRLRIHLGLTQRRMAYPMADLSEREREILSLTACGYTRPEVAEILFVSVETVKSHLKRVYSKLNVQTGPQAVAVATLVGELNTSLLQQHLFRDLPGFREAA